MINHRYLTLGMTLRWESFLTSPGLGWAPPPLNCHGIVQEGGARKETSDCSIRCPGPDEGQG